MAIAIGYKENFETLCCAVKNGDVCIVECTDKITHQLVNVICAVSADGTDVVLAPLAKMFDGNPYEELDPPQ